MPYARRPEGHATLILTRKLQALHAESQLPLNGSND